MGFPLVPVGAWTTSGQHMKWVLLDGDSDQRQEYHGMGVQPHALTLRLARGSCSKSAHHRYIPQELMGLA